MMSSRMFNISLIKPLSLSFAIALASGVSLSANADSSYGPVKSSDTLSKIVSRLYTGSKASRASIMQQIVVDNPWAFSNGDMNRLKLNTSLALPGEQWKNAKQPDAVITNNTKAAPVLKRVKAESVDRSVPDLTLEQMKGRIVFLDAERSSLIEQVSELKLETVLLGEKVQKLESDGRKSDEQLRILDAEIIRLTSLLKNNSNEAKVSNADLNQLVVLQEKLRLVQAETKALRAELSETQSKLTNNDNTSTQVNQTISQLTQENNRLKKTLQELQPGVNYYNNVTANGYNLSFMSGKLKLPLGLIVVGGALIALMLTTLVVTRRKKKVPEVITKTNSIDPFEDDESYTALLETDSNEIRGFAQSQTQPEENVFKMFDDGTLEMDLKLDMAEAYLQVSDLDSARAILQEVMLGGSKMQKRRASKLISKAA